MVNGLGLKEERQVGEIGAGAGDGLWYFLQRNG